VKKCILFSILILCLPFLTFSQKKKKQKQNPPQAQFDASKFDAMKWRNVGPFRGGRSTAVTGVTQDPDTYYFGSTGGGVWKTTDGGYSWKNISDGFFKTGSVGAIAVAPSDPNVLYVGMGEAPIRGVMTSHGDGVYKSTDAGHSWTHIGLDKTRQISDIRVHPQNPDWVYISAQGSPYMPTEDRGIYRSKDGGETWEKVLYVNEESGACDLSLDMTNPRILYAAFWDHQRLPHQMRSGGEGSGIWKSKDGGDTWEELTKGLPTTIMGKIGVVVSPADSKRIYAIIEAEKGGLYRSDDAGLTWKLINDDRTLRARSWYYMHIFADPVDADKVVILNAPFMQSTDGGKTFTRVQTPHGDNHDLWINPGQPSIMINGNDGGANISYNGGKTWSTQRNQPTAQFYRVNADNQFPYHIYGGQQDNSTVAIPNRWTGGGIPYDVFYSVGGCESGYSAFDPDDPRIVYSGCYQGIISEYDTKLKQGKDVMAYPELGLGQKAGDLKYRFNWNAPIIMSHHDRNTLYHGANLLLRSRDRGVSWTEISPELTKNVPEELGWGGGPITNEAAGGENYHTIMYVSESMDDPNTLWVGTDDGLVHVTFDGGENWLNVTPPGLQEGMINCIEISQHNPNKVMLAFDRYKFNDFTPNIYITQDAGKTWRKTTKGIAEDAHVRVVREDPEVPGLLYAGTEIGLYISTNDGSDWHPFQLNLPIVPITDLKLHHGDLIAATQGRAFWVLDDLTPIRNHEKVMAQENWAIFDIPTVSLWGGVRRDGQSMAGTNPDYGLVTYFHIPETMDSLDVGIHIKDNKGNTLRSFSKNAEEKSNQLKVKPGLNKFVWNLKKESYDNVKEIMTFGGTNGTTIIPGEYSVQYKIGNDSTMIPFELVDDPRLGIPKSAYVQKENQLRILEQTISELFEAVKDIRHVREQINTFQKRDAIKEDSILLAKGKSILTDIDSLESQLVQTKQKTFQDVINFPNQLDGKIMHIQNIIDRAYPPITKGQVKRVQDLANEWNSKKALYRKIVGKDLKEYNDLIDKSNIQFISPAAPGKKKNRT